MRFLILLFLLPVSLIAQQNKESNSIVAKAVAFIYSLNEEQKKKVLFSFNELNRYEWHYVPPTQIPRQGVAIKDLRSEQKEAAYKLLQAFLSKEGYEKTTNIMSLENVLHELQPNNKSRISENYFISIYGTPVTDSVWGWKFSGHHLALNFTVIKDKIAFAPFFFGANPATVGEGRQKGLQVMKAEEDLGLELVNMFTQDQKQKAIFQADAFSDIVTGTTSKIEPLKPVGIPAGDMTLIQMGILNKLIVAYLSSMPTAIAKSRLKRITSEDMNLLRFGWAGDIVAGKPHYYRIQGKTFLIEFDNTQNNANHIHAVWRDFNGDYGLDLLKEHYRNSPHHH
jgi:hypothetical protein